MHLKRDVCIELDGKKIITMRGARLLEVLMENDIFLRSDCGGKGKCGKCQAEILSASGRLERINSCTFIVSADIVIEIPQSSKLSSYVSSKAHSILPRIFTDRFRNACGKSCYGIAADLGTTTIALYLCDTVHGKILASLAVRNPQSLYGDDVMSRIRSAGENPKNLVSMQRIIVRAVEWGIKEMLLSQGIGDKKVSRMVAVGNPAMIHIFAGVDPHPIGVSPYQPAFFTSQKLQADRLGFSFSDVLIQTLPQASGFIGGDILSSAIAADLTGKPEGTLLIDLGTNGELLLKANGKIYATSCAIGPAFEGAAISCGMQALPGAIDAIILKSSEDSPDFTLINPFNDCSQLPIGICGTGVISGVAQFYRKNIITSTGAFIKNNAIQGLKRDVTGEMRYVIVSENRERKGMEVYISQKDIRSVQLGKAALATGIEFLLKEAGLGALQGIIVAGSFGTFLDPDDMMTLGMIPEIAPASIKHLGNLAGVGAVMVMCSDTYLEQSEKIVEQLCVIELAAKRDFQERFIQNLGFDFQKKR